MDTYGEVDFQGVTPDELLRRLKEIDGIARDGLDNGPPHDHQIAPRDALHMIRMRVRGLV